MLAGIIAYLQANWMGILVALLAIDQLLLGLFPKVALLGDLKDILTRLIGGGPTPPALK